MGLTIRPKRSTTAGAVPSGLLAFEIAINVTDKKVYVGSADGLSSVLISSLALSDHTGTTDNLIQGTTNKFYADALARASVSSSATGLIYTSSTGVFSLNASYAIPTTAKQTQWDTAYTQTQQWNGGSTNLVAATGRTSLGLVIGTDVQAYDADLQAIAGIAGTTGLLKKTAANTWSLDTSAYSTTTGTVTSVSASVPTGLSVSGSPITSSGTLAITFSVGYSIPTTTSQTNWDTAYTNRISSLTTTGSSGAATLTTNTLNIPTYTLSGLGGQASSTNLTSLAGLSYASASFVKMTSAGTFSLDTSTYLTGNQTITLSGDISGSGSTAITTTLATVSIAKGGTGQTTANAAVNALLPSQTGNSGKYLTTNGTDSSWGTVTSGSTTPTAMVEMFAGVITQSVSAGVVTTTAPTGYLLCNGDAVSRSTYSALWTALGQTSSPYGQGNGSTTFNLPDLRSRVPVGVGTGSGLTNRTLGGTVGTENETAPLPYHNHNNTVGSSAGGSNGITNTMNQANPHAHLNAVRAGSTGGNYYRIYDRFANESNTLYTENTDINHTHNIGINNAYAGSGGTHNNMQPSIGLNYIIKT